jgi:hypothetical protein
MKKGFKLLIGAAVVFSGTAFAVAIPGQSAQAAPATFVVNSTGDALDANPTDGICETATPGECTLIAAVTEVDANNNAPEQDTIEFNIPGAGPHTISPAASYQLREPVIIDGFSQPGSQPNTVAWPGAMDTVMQIIIDGTNTTGANGVLLLYANDITIKGLVVHSGFSSQLLCGDVENLNIQGNYLGTDVSGMMSLNNASNTGTPISTFGTENLTVGGPNPEDRNVLTGYDGMGFYSDYLAPEGHPSTPRNITLKGNNIFVGADGVTSLPPQLSYASVTFHNVDGITIGGEAAGEGNLIENAQGSGISLEYFARNATIKGNRIVGNGLTAGSAINIYSDAYNIEVGGDNVAARNVISSLTANGVEITQDAHDITVKNNYIGVADDGVSALGNGQNGIQINSGATDIVIGGPGAGNVIGDSQFGIGISGSSNITVQSNNIGVGADDTTIVSNSSNGINIDGDSTEILIGGTAANQANLIQNNGAAGIALNGSGANDVAIIGNSMSDNAGTAIDFLSNGVTPNDELDPDTGVNDLLNFPEVYEPVVNGANLDVEYVVDVPAGSYRVEFYSNSVADPSGNGEAETLIGTQNVTSLGSGEQTFSTTVSGNTHTNVFATITEIDGTTPSGFGATSEVGSRGVPPPPVTDVSVSLNLQNPEDVAQGAELVYDIAFTNNGPDELDLTEFAGVFATPPFAYQFTHPDLTATDLSNPTGFPGTYIVDSNNPDATCIWAEQGSAGLFLGFTDNPDYGFTACWYTGASTTLPSGAELTVQVAYDVAIDSELSFASYLVGATPSNSTDPDTEALQELVTDANGDFITAVQSAQTPINNFAISFLPADIGVSTELIEAPTNPTTGSRFVVRVSLVNRGPGALSLATYTNPNNPIFGGIFPGGDVSLVGSMTAGVQCLSVGPGSASVLGAAAQDHADHELYVCIDDASGETLSEGETFDFDLEFVTKPGARNTFSFYALQTTAADADVADFQTLFAATEDVLDTFTSDNYARVSYAAAGLPSGPDGSDSNDNNSGLGETGQNIILLVGVGLVIVAGTLYLMRTKNTSGSTNTSV